MSFASLCWFVSILAAAPAEAQVGLQLEAGLGGVAHAGRWATVRVTATNSGEPVTGRLELVVPGARTALPLELPPSANKRVETVLIPQMPYGVFGAVTDQAAAALRDGRRLVAVGQVSLTLLPEAERLLVVCSGEGASPRSGGPGLRFMDGVSLGEAGWALPLEQQAQLRVVPTASAHLSPAQMPVEWAGLQAADLLVLRDVAWQRLELDQRRAVRRWVEMGGRLLLCGEDPDGFRDEEGARLLPVELGGTRPLPALTAFPLPDRAPIRASAGQVTTIAARPRQGARVVLRIETGSPAGAAFAPRRAVSAADEGRRQETPAPREGGAPLVVMRTAGFGGVLWVGFDPFRVPPGSLAARRALWAFLISHASGADVPEPAFPHLEDVPAAVDPVRRLPHFPAPSRWTVGGFGLVYVLLFGPLHIWLLRRLRRTVRAWLLMPALSLLMTGGVLALGSAWGHAKVVFHSLSVLEATAGSRTAVEQNLAGLFSPTNRAFGLEIEDPAPTLRFLAGSPDENSSENTTPGGSPGGFRREGPALVMPDTREGDLCRWPSIGLTLWTFQLFRTERAADLGGEVRIDLDRRLAGRVINRTRYLLRAAYLQYSGRRQPLGDLAPGTARAVTTAGWRRLRDTSQASTDQAARTPSSGVSSGATNDLFGMAGSLLLGSAAGGTRPGSRSGVRGPLGTEVILVARVPGLMLPLRIPDVPRAAVEGLPEGAILLVRQSISAINE